MVRSRAVSANERPKKNTLLTCLVAGGIAVFVACLGSIGTCAGLIHCANVRNEEEVRAMVPGMRALLAHHPRRTQHEPDLARLEALIAAGEVESGAYALIATRYEVANIDGRLDEAEIDRIMATVHEVAARNGAAPASTGTSDFDEAF